MIPQLGGKSVLVTGGTRGLGKAIGMEFARVGARVFLTHRWGSVDDDELAAEFRKSGASIPTIVECDASDVTATQELMTQIRDDVGTLDVVISNVSFSKVIHDLSDLKKSTLDLSLSYSAWPIVDLTKSAYEILGHYPRYVLGISTDGGDICHPGYDLVGVSKAVLETLCRYLAVRLRPHGVCVNAVRVGLLDTESSRATFGDKGIEVMHQRMPGLFLDPQNVARCCVALCSGWMDSVTGQVITVDEGWSLTSPVTWVTRMAGQDEDNHHE